MKYLFIFGSGFLLGFLLLGGLVRKVVTVIAVASAPASAGSAPGTSAGGAAAAAGALGASADSLANAPAEVPELAPARTRPQAFSFYVYAPSTERVPAEVRATPEFASLYRRVLVANVEARLEYDIIQAGLTPAQFDSLVAVVADQAVERSAVFGQQWSGAEERDRVLEKISKETEAKLSQFLSDDQMEQLAGGFFGNQSVASTIERFATAGVPFSVDQLRSLIVDVPWKIKSGGDRANPEYKYFARRELRLGPDSPGLTPEQRQYMLLLAERQESAMLAQALKYAKVRDPEVFDLWPW